ncbi:hypothetical protein [Arthrobacter sp. SDTb3-6]|uniref:hypothetical protein n=1 Tax=Arthrobacter sp. SDTb3-6 TaxID=2713571 RepID=UPI00159D4DD2|nr:hypothetical protein [Arthrobacter sp. SDTb3-6]NVM97689.1 hypothetical protein [Arthrobacter sp. SDTb3-6]
MPTSSGDINASISLDASEFRRVAAQVRNEARDLGALSPTVNVDANVGRALSDLAAVDAAERRVGSSSVDMGKQGRTGILALVAAAPAAVAALGPIGAAAIGLGASFGVMAVSGVLAIKGIKDAMAEGTRTGDQYTVGLGSMEGMLDQLSHSAAVGMLGAFNGAVQDLSARMPFLNRMIYDASGQLGTLGGTALHGVLDAMQALNPLITAGGVELNKFVGWLAAMPASNGFSQFVDYAITNLPSVMTLIEGLVTMVGHVVESLAPLGPAVIAGFQVFTDIVNALPLPVLAGVVTAVAALGLSLKLLGNGMIAPVIVSIAEAIGLTGVMANLAVPVVGVLLAAITGLAVGFAASAASGGQATTVLTDYGDQLERDNGLIGINVRQTAAKALQDSGAYDAAKQLGISQQELTDAVLHQGTAWDSVKGKLAGAQQKIQEMGVTQPAEATKMSNALQVVTAAYGTNNDQILKAQAAAKNYNAAMDDQNGTTTALAGALGMTGSAYTAAVAAQASAKASTDANTASMQLQNDAAGLLKAALDGLNGKAISAAQAQNSFDSSLVNMGTHVSATGKKITFTTTSINDMSSASVTLRGQLNSQVQNLQNVVEANGGLANSTGKARQQMVTMRQQIIDNAVAHGVDRAAVTAYIDKILAIPKSVPPTKLQVDNAQALADARALQSYINSMHGTTLTNRIYSIYSESHVSTGQGGSGGLTRAEGGAIHRANGGSISPSYLASGGFPGHAVGTDTIPVWASEGEYMMKRASAQSIGAPALNYMNQTGKIPPTGGQPNITVYVTNPFTGEQVQAVVHTVATQAAGQVVDNFARDIRNRR